MISRIHFQSIAFFVGLACIIFSTQADSTVKINHFLSHMSCSLSGQSCMVISSDVINNNTEFTIYSSEDAGNTWSKINKLPIKATPEGGWADLVSLNFHCDEKYAKDCTVSVIDYTELAEDNSIKTFHTIDGGLTWKSSSGDFYPANVSCDDNNVHCLTVNEDYDMDKDKFVSRISQSEDGGQTWSLLQGVTNPSHNGNLACDRTLTNCMLEEGVHKPCYSNACTHINHSVSVTHNAAVEWNDIEFKWSSYKHDNYEHPSPPYDTNLFCDRNTCAKGLISGVSDDKPMIAFTDDHGEHWVSPIMLKPLPANMLPNGPNIVKCSENTLKCLAVYSAHSDDWKSVHSFNYTSKDGGLTWKGPFAFSAPVQIGAFFCDSTGSKCVAMSERLDRFLSNDGGKTWSKPTNIIRD